MRTTGADDVTKTDEDGRFELRERSDHQWQVRVAADGYQLAFADPVPSGASRAEVTIRVNRGDQAAPRTPTQEANVAGFVVGPSGRPIPYARVMVNRSVGWTPTFSADETTLADEAGRFTLTASRSGPHMIRAHRLGNCVAGTALVDLDAAKAAEGVRIVVPDGVVLRGRYMAGRDQPLPDVIVVATRGDLAGASWAVTDSEGWFTLQGLPEDEVFLKVRDLRVPGGGHLVSATAGELDSPLRVDLQPVLRERPVRGRAIRFVGAVPPDGTAVRIGGRNASGGGTGGTAYVFDGRVRLPNSDTTTWTFTGPGYYAGPVEIATGADTPEVEVELGRGLAIRGTVRTSTGQPVPGASIAIPHKVAWDGSQEHDRHVHTDAQGRFHFPGVEPGERFALKVHATGFVGTSVETERSNGSLDVALMREGRVSGSVVPLEGEDLPPHWRLTVRQVDGSARAWTQAGATRARFSCRHMSPGTWALRVVTRDGAEGPPTTIRIEEGQVVEDLVVTAPGLGRVISGRIHDDEGRGVSGARVLLFAASTGGDPLRRTHTPAGGSFQFQSLPPGRYDLRIEPRREGPVGGAARAGIEAGTSGIDIALPKRGRVVGRLVGEPERRLGMCVIHLVRDGETVTWQDLTRRSGRTDGHHRDGHFVIDHVDPGTYRLIVVETEDLRGYGLGVGTADEPLVVAPGATVRDVRVRVRRSSSLTVALLDAAGARSKQGEVQITHTHWGTLRRSIREHGYLGFRFLPPGDWDIRTRPSEADAWSEATTLRLDPGQMREIERRLRER